MRSATLLGAAISAENGTGRLGGPLRYPPTTGTCALDLGGSVSSVGAQRPPNACFLFQEAVLLERPAINAYGPMSED